MKKIMAALAITVMLYGVLAPLAMAQDSIAFGVEATDEELAAIYAEGTFPWGYCTWFADDYIRKNWKAFPKGTKWQGNAGDWLKNASKAGAATGSTAKKGAIVVTKEGSIGHVAVVTSVDTKKKTMTLSEMNYKGFGKVSTRTISTNSSLIKGFIYPK